MEMDHEVIHGIYFADFRVSDLREQFDGFLSRASTCSRKVTVQPAANE
jgi:hypothetical protein